MLVPTAARGLTRRRRDPSIPLRCARDDKGWGAVRIRRKIERVLVGSAWVVEDAEPYEGIAPRQNP